MLTLNVSLTSLSQRTEQLLIDETHRKLCIFVISAEIQLKLSHLCLSQILVRVCASV